MLKKKYLLGMGKTKKAKVYSKSFQRMVKEAQSQPGVKEALAVYGDYNELLIQTQEYLGLTQKPESFSANNSSQ